MDMDMEMEMEMNIFGSICWLLPLLLVLPYRSWWLGWESHNMADTGQSQWKKRVSHPSHGQDRYCWRGWFSGQRSAGQEHDGQDWLAWLWYATGSVTVAFGVQLWRQSDRHALTLIVLFGKINISLQFQSPLILTREVHPRYVLPSIHSPSI